MSCGGIPNPTAIDDKFKTPTLHNVSRTAPYMHDGSIATLEGVVDYYNRGGNRNAFIDPELRRLNNSEYTYACRANCVAWSRRRARIRRKTTSYSDDANGNLANLTDANSHTTQNGLLKKE
ncbi:MAG TPA: hypothetical protein VN736_29520 [Candidatus Limnocylindrales bacterium]|nr:hypothetical protein [Candidatus Limnocylindrales bacterium]